MSSYRAVGGLREIAGDYDLFLIDQFGVLHDGQAPYPGAIRVLEKLKSEAKTVVLLSNSGRRSTANATRMEALGFPSDLYDHFVTSGEVAWHQLSAGSGAGQTRRCLLLSRGGTRSAVEGLGLELVEDGADADLVLLAGSDGDSVPLEHYLENLRPAAERKVPCLCTNPDKIMITAAGLRYGAGRIAEEYEALGGPVEWIGKPWPSIYRFALERCSGADGEGEDKRIIGIGDSIEHDIAGARGIGAASLLIKGGILADADEAELSALFAKYKAAPDFLSQSFAWD
ncbi:TIGR01459 family HAD-type hydrolase [Denitrobaculum tricleocarpae]|uniref:TIGR01459 family HAD-type hydrolase n=1 Tax=Denitrobaculum tricleocarpae TaxID=2591009 RepID=A0A545U0V0_9PROT|nr:TIGR01459 family HAD-type hydrolase [Denitrobaculum tricleocarpae]TQV83074.1 TIGR01459 family HAD-type hydrolase [Denitrobaculum tricleocarpae]